MLFGVRCEVWTCYQSSRIESFSEHRKWNKTHIGSCQEDAVDGMKRGLLWGNCGYSFSYNKDLLMLVDSPSVFAHSWIVNISICFLHLCSSWSLLYCLLFSKMRLKKQNKTLLLIVWGSFFSWPSEASVMRTYMVRVVDIRWVRSWSSYSRIPWMLNMIPSSDENEKVYEDDTNITFEGFIIASK